MRMQQSINDGFKVLVVFAAVLPCVSVIGAEQADRQSGAVATRPISTAGGGPEVTARLLALNEDAIRRALNDDDYDLAAERIGTSRKLLERGAGDVSAKQKAEMRASLDVLARLIEVRRADGAERQRAARRRIAIAVERERLALGSEQRPGVARAAAAPVRPAATDDAIPVGDPKAPGRGVVLYPDVERWRAISQRQPIASESPQDARGSQQLARPRPAIVVPEGASFAEAIDAIRQTGGLSIDANWNVLARAGIERSTTTQGLRLGGVRLGTAIQFLLDDVSGAAGVRLGYTIVDGTVWISTVEDLSTKSWVRVYDVSDLLLNVRSFRAPTDIFSSASMGNQGTGGGTLGGGGVR